MTSKNDAVYVQHILENIALVENKFSSTDAKTQFLNDIFFRFGVYYALQTMSESTQKLSTQLKQNIPEIPWQDIADFRNVLAHDYLGDVDPHIVLEVIEKHLPMLKAAVKKLKG